jgi:hypothetical protein
MPTAGRDRMDSRDIERARAQIGQLARDMLSGKLSFIEGSRLIWRLRTDACLPERDPDLMKFEGIDSETDALPVGRIRDLWAPDALQRLQPEIERRELWAREFGWAACQRLASRFGSPVSEE